MPSAKEFESAVLGTLILDSFTSDEIISALSVDCFYDDKNQIIFKEIESLSKKQVSINLLTVVRALKEANVLDYVGGPSAIAKLTMPIASTEQIEYQVKILLQYNIQRKLITFARNLEASAFRSNADPLDLHEKAITSLDKLADFTFDSEDVVKVKTAVDEQREVAAKRKAAFESGMIEGAVTGIQKVDKFLGGLKPGNLIILAAPASMGKTAFALNCAYASATKGIPVLIFSKEMTRVELVERLIIKHVHGQIDNHNLSRGSLTPKEIDLMERAQIFIEGLPIELSDANQTISSIRRKSKRWNMKSKDGLIIDDYIQLSEGEDSKNDSREREIGKISRGCKKIAAELKVPYLALSQLSRAHEKRDNKRGILSDLRDSGSLEQDANVVIFLYREEYYLKMTDQAIPEESIGEMEVLIRKNRGGSVGPAKCYYNTSMSNLYDSRSEMPDLRYNEPSIYFSSPKMQPSVHWSEQGRDDEMI